MSLFVVLRLLKIKIPNIEIDLAWFQFALLNFSSEPLPPHPPSFLLPMLNK